MSSNKRKTVITGATGMLGGALVAELLGRGYGDITLLVRSTSSLDKLWKSMDRAGAKYDKNRFTVVETSLSNPHRLREAMHGAALVFHCAAAVTFDDGAQEIIAANTEITTHIVDAAMDCKVDLLVHVSSIATLDAMQGDKWIDEERRIESPSGHSPYARSKFFAENQVVRAREMGLGTVIVQPAVIIGPGDWKGGGSASIIPFISGGVPVYTNGVSGYVDVTDVARAMVSLCEERSARGENFILCGANLTFRELITMGAQAVGRKKPFIRAGRKLTGMAWRADALAAKILPRHKATLSRATARTALAKNYYDGEKVKKFINFEYSPMQDTIERVVKEFYSDNRK